jgi:23S rRNA pseudouridine955/2504/2580 synthase/23S rRNA pseudouridine1911/1915/1917 synthase
LIKNKPEILFENESFVVVNKPPGLLSIPGRDASEISVKTLLSRQYGQIFTVHRIDRDTSGLILFARNEDSHRYLNGLFEEREVGKDYLGIVSGTLSEKKGVIDGPIAENQHQAGTMLIHKRGKPSITEYEVQEEFGLYSLIRFRILTGRTHQIRVHMQWQSHPIVCDEIYGDPSPILLSSFKRNFKLSRAEESEKPILNRLGLHAHLLQFTDDRNIAREFEAPLPRDFQAFLSQLRKWKNL